MGLTLARWFSLYNSCGRTDAYSFNLSLYPNLVLGPLRIDHLIPSHISLNSLFFPFFLFFWGHKACIGGRMRVCQVHRNHTHITSFHMSDERSTLTIQRDVKWLAGGMWFLLCPKLLFFFFDNPVPITLSNLQCNDKIVYFCIYFFFQKNQNKKTIS